MTDLEKILEDLKKTLTKDRFTHTLGVMYTAECLAMRYNIDMDKAALAGLLHDCAKCLPKEEMKRLVEEAGIILTDTEQSNPGLLHAKAGSILAREKYGVTDPEILDAIACHTTGRPHMTPLDKIIYIADFIKTEKDLQIYA